MKKKIYIVEFDHVEWRCFSAHFTSKPQEKYISCKKPTYLACVYVNQADHVTKSDLNSVLKMAATIMTWFSRGIPLGIGKSRRKWNIYNMPIKPWIANLSIRDEDYCCQCSCFDHSVSIGLGSLLCSPPRDFKQYWIWPSLRSERKSSKRVRFESDYIFMPYFIVYYVILYFLTWTIEFHFLSPASLDCANL